MKTLVEARRRFLLRTVARSKAGVTLIAALALFAGCKRPAAVSLVDPPDGRKASDFPELAEDVFKPMDGGLPLSADEIKGRNTWNLWCGGNEQFWDRMSRESYGLVDLLKVIDSRKRDSRFKDLGLINQPGYRQAGKPDKYGLFIDEPVPGEEEPASIDRRVYGRATGIMGFRLFDNPDFDAAAAKWDSSRFYNDEQYAADSKLIRPYRVGVSCGSCHIAFHPSHPPADPVNPKWEDLASAIGNQYIKELRAFSGTIKPGGFFWEMLESQPRGTSDTSRIATDHINNPNAINPIFALGERLSIAVDEDLGGESVLLPDAKSRARVPHVLKDGADSVGVAGATLRVYINIGMFSQHWLQQHNALIGLRGQSPFSIRTAQASSAYWLATEQKFANIGKFFSRLKSFRLEDAPGGASFITRDAEVMRRGKLVFAENCADCHSSKRPPVGTADVTAWFKEAVLANSFRDDNFFSDEKRYSVSRIKSNSARAAATNAKRGQVWSNFSSETYKNLPQVGEVDVWNPFTGASEKYQIPDGGPGYYRTPSLISLWSSAPFLHNNTLGKYTGDPSVNGRMEAFNDAVGKLLWPERRLGTNSVWRTQRECQFQINSAVLPGLLAKLLRVANAIDADGYFRIGPIPQGTPINLLANVDPATDPKDLIRVLLKAKSALLKIKVLGLDSADAKQLLRDEVGLALWKVSKCPDFVEDKGHYFGTDLPDADKLALIDYLKTL